MMEPIKNIEPLLDPKDVKMVLKCSLPQIYKLAASGRLPCIRIPCEGMGKKRKRDMVRFKLSDIREFIENHYMTT